MTGIIWAMGKCEKCHLTYYDFTIQEHGRKIYRICGCSDVIQETSDQIQCLVSCVDKDDKSQ